MNDFNGKTEFNQFKYVVMARLNEFEQHWGQMNMFDPYRYPKHETFEKWFDHVLEYVTDNVNSN